MAHHYRIHTVAEQASNYHTLLAGGLWAAHTHRTRTQSSMQAASLHLVRGVEAAAASQDFRPPARFLPPDAWKALQCKRYLCSSACAQLTCVSPCAAVVIFAARCSKTRPLIPLHPRWRMAPRMQKAASRGPAQRHNEVSFKIERPERSGPTAPRCAARCAALRPPRWCTPPMRCETCTNAAACVCPGSEVGRRMCDASN